MSDDAKFAIELILTLINTLVAAIGLYFVALELRRTRKTTKGEFLLHLDEILNSFDDVTQATFEKSWIPSESISDDKETGTISWARTNNYMGLFERIMLLIDDKILDLETFSRLYGYKVRYLILNEAAYNKLVEKGVGWVLLIRLAKNLADLRRDDITIQEDQWKEFFKRVDTLTQMHLKLSA